MSFKQNQYNRVINLIGQSNIFNKDKGNGVFRGKPRPFILMNEINNLYPDIVDDCIQYFKKNRISWWNGKLTNHTLSSQVACLNHLFFIRNEKEAVLAIVKQIDPDITDVLEIETDEYMPAFIQFEAVSHKDHLNEKSPTRGRNCTSIDALIYGVHKDGRRIIFPIEWKYVENYGNVDKANGEAGKARTMRYTDLINRSTQLISNDQDIYYYEPFYQLMRQTLWAEQLIAHKDAETMKADDFIHIHVIPCGNYELLHKVYPRSKKGMEETWRTCIRSQEKYVLISPRDFLKPIDKTCYKNLLAYLNERYWV